MKVERFVKIWMGCVGLGLWPGLGVKAQLEADPPIVRTEQGLLEGVSGSGIKTFKGIPFAAAPVGDLRWKPPGDAPVWTGIRKADAFGPRAMQLSIYGDMFFRASGMSEDCLYLNVWTPASSGEEGYPVLVYFYGGGYRAGDGSEPRYDGESMARRGIVSVTVNYRLGVFGFMAHPELTAESNHAGSGNYALMDQAAALAWVRNNIHYFGGDPQRVTIAGESCGARSVCAQMASPLSKDLFSAAIGESGALMNSTIVPLSLSDAEALGLAFARLAGGKTLKELRGMPAEEILETSGLEGAPYFPPNVDNYFFPDYPSRIFAEGKQAKVPLLVGWNSMEMNHMFLFGQLEPTLDRYRRVLEELYGSHAMEALQMYPAQTDGEVVRAATDLAGDRFAGFNTWKWMELHRETGESPVFRYFYARPRPAMRSEIGPASPGFAGGIVRGETSEEPPAVVGAVHSAEIEYALGNLSTNRVYDWQPEDFRVSDVMQGFFENFIRSHDPNGPGLPSWPAANEDIRWQMHLDAESHSELDPHAERYDWLDRLPPALTHTPDPAIR
ncbi:MAG: carboxylesterase family protein [Bacteroidales bacterium]